ncbi:MAG TPA: 1-(5-phosphoribosyl)-5-[(5-phosphoribosylamino)methylideneamino]imidazole-4-carboxamide isomerase [Aquella sp.]|nr:1-(5-phosphoribosyl)-5-[(5-phosphoribosylamino)methylideneamino]imidazole-4-carboxamide isomerase [Aquella sp.]
MIIFPAIDLRNGKCVRLTKGDFATTKVYNDNPLLMLESFKQHNFSWVHMVDLDGAKQGSPAQGEIIANLVKHSGLNIQVGGGIRTKADIEYLLSSGVKRVVLGSICVSNPELVKGWFDQFGSEKIVLALDCQLKDDVPVVKTHGWQEDSQKNIWDLLEFYDLVKYVLCTDISVDGTLAGPSIKLYKQIMNKFPQVNLIASGGVGNIDHLLELNELGVYGVVVGKAIYEGTIKLDDITKLSVEK